MIEFLIVFLGLLTVMAAVLYIRYKLTHWEDIVDEYGCEIRYDLNFIHGFWSEFQRGPNSFPMSNHYLKVAPTTRGLYLQYDLSFEPNIYKPVFIPWGSIIVKYSEKGHHKGGIEYLILKNSIELGSIFLQFPISDEIIEKAQEFGANLVIRK